MQKTAKKSFFILFLALITVGAVSFNVFAAKSAPAAAESENSLITLWQFIASGGVTMIFLGLISVAALATILYHFKSVTPEKLTPQDFIENLLSLIERKSYDKAITVCSQQQDNLISQITLPALKKIEKGPNLFEETIQYEGKARIETLWQNLTYIGDIAIIAPMVGLLGTIIGMIDAFHYFRGGSIHPAVLTQGLAKAMVNTAFGLIIAVPCLIFYSYFRGRVSRISSTTEGIASEISQIVKKNLK